MPMTTSPRACVGADADLVERDLADAFGNPAPAA